MNPFNPQHRGGSQVAPHVPPTFGLPVDRERPITPPPQGFPAGTITLAIYRLLPGGGAGGAWEVVGRVPFDNEPATRALVARLPAGRYRIAACGPDGRVRPGGQFAYERHELSLALRPVRARAPRDYRKGGAHPSTTTQLLALNDEVTELRRRLARSRKKRGRLLALVARLDQEVERLVRDGQVSSVVADHLEEVTGQQFHRSATTSFERRVQVPDDVRVAIASRALDASAR